MVHDPAAAPAPPRRAGGGQSALGDRDRHVGTCGVVVADPHAPALVGRRSTDRHVAAERDEDTASGRSRRRGGDPVRGQRLRRGAKVEPDPAGHQQRSGISIPTHPPPTGRRTRRGDRFTVAGHVREVPVVAEHPHGLTDRRVDHAIGQFRGMQRDAHGLGQQRAHRHRRAAVGVQAGDLRIGSEPAARRVDGGQLGVQDIAGRSQSGRVGDDDDRRCPQSSPLRAAQR